VQPSRLREVPLTREEPSARQPNPGPFVEVEVRALEDQLKEGHSRGFTVMCDESERLGGTNTAPSPLVYFTMGMGF
jgi:hypothetical protein